MKRIAKSIAGAIAVVAAGLFVGVSDAWAVVQYTDLTGKIVIQYDSAECSGEFFTTTCSAGGSTCSIGLILGMSTTCTTSGKTFTATCYASSGAVTTLTCRQSSAVMNTTPGPYSPNYQQP